ncbi:uncharacterized protein LOC114294159 [Camellia sinensis]|uniref:uncharacterized protein LOC114294159 n=1 Tax=Camellia sinensis TaxID=4442 RepID=UPI001036BD07|nr:uncharacterized protein LOC114294159 [Camellia sinensis]
MRENETLRSYNSRYWETFNQIGDCPTNLAIAQYKRGLPVGNKLRDLMTMMPPLTMEALIERVHQHIRVEEDSARAKVKSGTTTLSNKKTTAKVNTIEQPSRSGRGRRANREDPEKRKLRVRTTITTVFNKPIYQILSEIRNEPFVRRPAKLGEAQRGYDERSCCTFHDKKGHRTENCTPLRQYLEELVVVGPLDRYIEGKTQPAPQEPNKPNGMPVDDPPQGIINVIHGVVEPERILIDQGSSGEIMYYKTFKQLKLENKDLALATSPLAGFNSMPEWPGSEIKADNRRVLGTNPMSQFAFPYSFNGVLAISDWFT